MAAQIGQTGHPMVQTAAEHPLIADLAQATGIARKTIAEQLNRAAVVDAVVGILAAGYLRPGVPGERVAAAAGLTKAELGTGIVRYHDHHHREMRATQQAHKQRTHKRHVPVGEPPSPEHRWCKRGVEAPDGHVGHWVLFEEMGKKKDRPEGIGDWCKECFREYWRSKVARGQEASKPEPVVASASVLAPLRSKRRQSRKRRRRVSGPTCVECKTPMVTVDGRLQCVAERCSIGVVNRNRARRAYLRARKAIG